MSRSPGRPSYSTSRSGRAASRVSVNERSIAIRVRTPRGNNSDTTPSVVINIFWYYQAAQSRIHTTLNEKLNAKKRRPTQTDGGKTNTSEYASSINTDESVNSEEENEKLPSGKSSGYSTISHGPSSIGKSTLGYSLNHNSGKLEDSPTSNSHTEKQVYFWSGTWLKNKTKHYFLFNSSHA